MSSIIFNSKHHGHLQLQGSERMHLLAEVARLAAGTSVGEGPGPYVGVPQFNAVMREVATDVARLICRISAQVEFTIWVDGPDRNWLSDLVGEGLQQQVLRPDMGWLEVQQMLQAQDDEPVFISTTQGLVFPSLEQWPGTAEDWSHLTPLERWAWAEQELRDESKREDDTAYLANHPSLMAAPFSRQLRPSNWHNYFFAE
jgi:hypothetical protein